MSHAAGPEASGPAAAPRRFSALILAGQRAGGDPLARAAGVDHKALLPVRGVPMLARVAGCLAAVAGVRRIDVSAERADLLAADPELVRLRDAGLLHHRPCGASPATSVRDALRAPGEAGPLLVTTSDHPLLAPPMIERFLADAEASGAEVAAGVVAESVLRARFPDVPRTFIPLRGERVTGANLFWFRSPAGAAAADFWRRTEAVRKQPWRLASLFGAGALARFALRRLDLDDVAATIGERVGLEVAAVRLPFAECGIDVDREADLALVERILGDA